ncbi:hypothetical protein CK203_031331 [Vitis vinifera]|uniref:Uncharacterized protein n=1 Tax=Vitis vinifera TaxID=29760 RepID=A0A438IXH3_VITVI|nr:hypothetical protein CK203_031331 [Vitis vinifera]
MEFSSEMNIYRESELSGDFEGEIRERRNQQENNQGALVDPQPISPTGNSTYYPRTGTSLILCHMVVIEIIKRVLKKKDNMIRLVPARIESGRVNWSWSLFRDSRSRGRKGLLDAPAPSVRGSRAF